MVGREAPIAIAKPRWLGGPRGMVEVMDAEWREGVKKREGE